MAHRSYFLFLQALLVQYVDSVFVCVCIWDNFSASDWSKIGDVARRRNMYLDYEVIEVDELDKGIISVAVGKQDE